MSEFLPSSPIYLHIDLTILTSSHPNCQSSPSGDSDALIPFSLDGLSLHSLSVTVQTDPLVDMVSECDDVPDYSSL